MALMRDTTLEKVLKDRITSHYENMILRSPEAMMEGARAPREWDDAMERYLSRITAPLDRGVIANTLLTILILHAVEITERKVVENSDDNEHTINSSAYRNRQSLFMDNLKGLVKKGMLGICTDSANAEGRTPDNRTWTSAGLAEVQQAWADIKGVIATFDYADRVAMIRR
jgi:hypothetical protein